MRSASKEKSKRAFIPATPEFRGRGNHYTMTGIGTAIILLSLVAAVLLGLWIIR